MLNYCRICSLVAPALIYFSCSAQPSVSNEMELVSAVMVKDSALIQEEVCALETKNGELFVAWVDRKKGTDEKYVSFTLSRNGQKDWLPVTTYDSKEYIWTGNPAIAEDDAGNLYLMVMSCNYEQNNMPDKGNLELCTSHDGGKTWSAWKKVVEHTVATKDIPDKPVLLAQGNGNLYLAYISFTFNAAEIEKSHGALMFSKSTNGGNSWQTPFEIRSERVWKPTTMLEAMQLGTFDLGEQGPSMAFAEGKLLLAWGGYAQQGIYLTTSADDGETFAIGKKIVETKTSVPVTQLIVDIKGKHKAIVWHDAHKLGEVSYASYLPETDSWKTMKIASEASIISGAFDKNGRLYLLWNEVSKGIPQTKYSYWVPGEERAASTWRLLEDPSANNNYFIGAYQQLLVDSKNRKHAFFIDWQQPGGRLMHASWD